MFKALLLLQVFILCYSLHLWLMNIILYLKHTLLNMYRVLFHFIPNTKL